MFQERRCVCVCLFLIAKSPQWPLTAGSRCLPFTGVQTSSALTVLNDAMLLQRPTQLHSLTPALHLPILQEPVNQLAARKRALIQNPVLLPQLQQDGVFVGDETEKNR